LKSLFIFVSRVALLELIVSAFHLLDESILFETISVVFTISSSKISPVVSSITASFITFGVFSGFSYLLIKTSFTLIFSFFSWI